MIYLTLFITAFISGSLFPLGSEALLIYDIKSGHSFFWVIFVATIGNTIGAVLNYYLGLKGEAFLERKGYLKKDQMKKAKDRFKRYGALALLLSPLPIIGDPITFVAGIMHYNFKKFFIIVLFAKFIRYLILAYTTALL